MYIPRVRCRQCTYGSIDEKKDVSRECHTCVRQRGSEVLGRDLFGVIQI